MAYPAGITTRVVRIGPLLDINGTPLNLPRAEIMAEAAFTTKAGATLFRAPIPAPVRNGVGEVTLPCTDQPGLTDGRDLVLRDFTYTWTFPQANQNTDDVPDVTFLVPDAAGPLQLHPNVSLLRSAGTLDLAPESLLQAQAAAADAADSARAANEHRQAAQAGALSAAASAQTAAVDAVNARAAATGVRGRLGLRTDLLGKMPGGRPTILQIYAASEVPSSGTPGTGTSGPTPWGDIPGKPLTFPPTIGSTSTTAVAGDDARLANAREPLAHTHAIAQILGLEERLLAYISQDDLDELYSQQQLFAPLESPMFTGTPTAPDPDPSGANQQQIATVGFVLANVGSGEGGVAAKATSSLPGVVLLPGGTPGVLGGTWDKPFVFGWDQKADAAATTNALANRATISQLNGKQAALPSGTAAQYLRGDLVMADLNAGVVGLGAVDNVRDVDKVTSTKQQASIDTAIAKQAGGAGPQLTANWSGGVVIPASWWGASVTVTLTGNVTSITVNAPADDTLSRSIFLVVKQGSTVRTIAANAWTNVLFVNGGSEPVITAVAGARDVLSIARVNAENYGFTGGANFA